LGDGFYKFKEIPMNTKLALRLLAAVALSVASLASQAALFAQSSYNATTTFTDRNPSTTMTLAYDGTNYYTSSGGSSNSPYAQYDSAGNFIANASPGIDFRSVFTNSSNNLLARGYSNNQIYQQSSFGNFNSVATLSGGTLDDQSAVVINTSNTEYLAHISGLVSRWDTAGNFLGSIALTGYVDNGYPSNRGMATVGNELLTYFGGVLTAWDSGTGSNLGSTILNGAGTSFNSDFSYSYANGQFWVVDNAGGTWRGYDVGLSANQVPEPSTLVLLGLGLLGLSALQKRKA
jgi:hypothetical protein